VGTERELELDYGVETPKYFFLLQNGQLSSICSEDVNCRPGALKRTKILTNAFSLQRPNL
jgi:hypothetical protein